MLQSDADVEFLEESGPILSYRLPSNGLRILLYPLKGVSVAAFMVTYHVGSRNEGAGTTGATHILEHLMFKGTEQFNRKRGTSVFNVLQGVGAQVNATTWLDRTNYYEVLPSRHLDLAMRIEADRMRNALISEEDLDSERTVILNEYDRGENEPLRKLYHAVWSAAFLAHPYHHPTIGWRSDIESVTASQLRDYYDTFYWPNNATASVIGGFDPKQVLNSVASHFGPIGPSAGSIPETTTREPKQRGERRVVVRQAGQLGAVMIAYKAPSGLDRDSDSLDLLARVLSSGKSSRYHRSLTDKGLTSMVAASMSRFRDPGLFVSYALLAPESTHQEVEATLVREMQEIAENGVSEAELKRAKNQLRAQEAYGRDGPFAIASQLNEAIAAGDWRSYTSYVDRIERIERADLQRVAEEYLQEDVRTVGHYVPEVHELSQDSGAD